MAGMKASSSSEGFFQKAPVVPNQLADDEAFHRALKFFLPNKVWNATTPSIKAFGDLAISQEVLDHVTESERHPPHVVSHSSFGVRLDKLVTSAGWRALQDIGIRNGIVAAAYEQQYGSYSRLYQFALYQLWTASAAFVTCPSAMTDGAAKLLLSHASKNPDFARAAERLVSRDTKVAWTSGQWMTERTGGSDVSGTETVATWDPTGQGSERGPWSISGFKWFSSATDSDMTVLLAQTKKGLSVFYAPMYSDRPACTLNGIKIQRLKNKMGSKALPTAELELNNMRAYLIGEEGRGIKEIATILNITRVHTAVSAIGFWGRGLAIARAFSRVRLVKRGMRLIDVPAHIVTLADQLVTYRAWTFMTLFTTLLLGREECPYDKQAHQYEFMLPGDVQQNMLLLRLFTPVVKAQASKAAIHGLQECMEALGGVGYLENEDQIFNIARLFRDCNVLSIWEGTTNIMAEDLLRVLKGKQHDAAMGALESWLASVLEASPSSDDLRELTEIVSGAFRTWKATVVTSGPDILKSNGRDIMQKLGSVVGSALLIADASSHHQQEDGSAADVAKRWIVLSGLTSNPLICKWKMPIVTCRRLVAGPDPAKLPARAQL